MVVVTAQSTRKQQIEKQATTLFREKGYAATSMRDLAAILGIEAASLYSHIRSKEEILQNICFRMANAFFLAIDKLDEASPDLQLATAIRAHFRVIAQNIDASAVFFNEWRHLSEPSLSEFLALRARYEQSFIQIIDQGIRQGRFRPVDQKLAMMTILSSINGTQQWYKPKGKMSVDEIGDQLSGLLINGIINTANK
jgi:AcrR family transcriptional regulator